MLDGMGVIPLIGAETLVCIMPLWQFYGEPLESPLDWVWAGETNIQGKPWMDPKA